MLQKLLPIIIIAVAGVAGGGGGFFAKSMMSGKASAESADDAHGEASDDGHGKKKGKKGGHGEESASSTYMKFGRQFVVPVVHKGRPKSMVILDINIEVDGSYDESIYALEPRLRDAFLSKLLELSSQNMLPQMLEDADKLDYTKEELLETSREIMGDAALNVLILDLGIQNY